jgi:tetratricopeptide (TPR) repeat protein
MPFIPNYLFVGRRQDLIRIAKALKGGQTAAISQIVAITGIGGIGKTQLACEFVHRYGQYFTGGVYWLNFDDPKAVPAEIAACSWPGEEGLELQTQIRLVLSTWQSALPRLLVLDNCEDAELLAKWRPPTGSCRILVTSRKSKWDQALSVDLLPLGVLDRNESVSLLKQLLKSISTDEAGKIAEELGDLPLALHLAGSFLCEYRKIISPADYLCQLKDETLLDHPSLTGRGASFSPTGHELHVAKSFALSLGKLNADDSVDELAMHILARTAYFAPGIPIPRDLLLKTIDSSEENFEATLQIEDALKRLGNLGFIEIEQEGSIVMHRLVASFVRNLQRDSEAQADAETAVLIEARRINSTGYPSGLLAWQPHLRMVTNRAQKRGDERGSDLSSALGYHLHAIGDYAGAYPNYQKALEIRGKVLGEEHPDTAGSLNNLGFLLQAMGDYEGARPYYEQALEINRKVVGEKHPNTATSLNNLAILHYYKGGFRIAFDLMHRALGIRLNVLGPDHPDTHSAQQSLTVIQESLKKPG